MRTYIFTIGAKEQERRMVKKMDILRYFSPRVAGILASVSDLHEWDEIRLRAGAPPVLRGRRGDEPAGKLLCTSEDIDFTFCAVCDNSVHSYEEQIREGFVTVEGGHRAGLCGTAVKRGGKIRTVKNISSINFRIARQVTGCAEGICREVFSGGLCGVLVAGAPMSGKTTVLRDMCRYLAGRYRVALIDERSEIAAVCSGVPQNDTGIMCDVFDGYSKAEGIMTAVRTMSPQIIICDEIGGRKDIRAIRDSLSSGVCIAASVHAGTPYELTGRKNIMRLIKTGVFSYIVFLETCGRTGTVMRLNDLMSVCGKKRKCLQRSLE